MLLFSLLIHSLVSLGKLLDGEYGNSVNDKTDNGVNDCNVSPSNCAAAEPSYCKYSDCLNKDLRAECEYETEGSKLNSFVGVLGYECGKRCICDIVCGKEYCVKKSVCDKEEDVLCGVAPAHRNCKASYKTDRASDVRPKHPRTRLTHLGVRFVDHSSK